MKPGRSFPGVGVSVIVVHDHDFILIRRTGAHDPGSWGAPGGWIEWGESFEHAAHREVYEEIGVEIKNSRMFAITNDVFDTVHSVTLWLVASWDSGRPEIKEPDKATDIGWFHPGNLPEPLFLPLQNLDIQKLADAISSSVKP